MKLLSKLLLLLTIIISGVFYVHYGANWNLFYADALGYYSYLPSTFIYNNFGSFETLPLDRGIPLDIIDYFLSFERDTPPAPTGNYMNRYTYGVALLQLPFFLVAHVYSYMAGLPTNGYTELYENIVRVSTTCYVLLGLFFLYKLLINFFKKEIVTTGLCLLLLGSNLFWFTFYQVGMSHSYLFFLQSCLLYLTYLFYKQPNYIKGFLMGLLIGIITMTRQSDFIFILVPVFYGVISWVSIKQRFSWLYQNKAILALGTLGFFIALSPQLIIWKIYAGSWLYFSYTGQGFDWLRPHIFEGLFGVNNGWLIYSPIFIIVVLGFFYSKFFKSFALSGILLLLLFIYVSYAWWCYWYMFGFGSRPMISLYPLLAFPLCALLKRSIKWSIWFQGILTICIVFTVFASLNLTHAAVQYRIISDDTNWTYFFHTFYKQKISINDLVLFDCQEVQPDPSNLKKIKSGNLYNLDTARGENILYDSARHSYVYHLKNGEEFANISFIERIEKNMNVDYLHCRAEVRVPQFINPSAVFSMSIERKDSIILWKSIRLNNKIGWQDSVCDHTFLSVIHGHENVWDTVSFFIEVPRGELFIDDVVQFGIWNIPKTEMYFDNLKLEYWREK